MHSQRLGPSPDPCLQQPFSPLRFGVLAALLITALPIGATLLFVLADWHYGVQLASLVIDTAAVALYTFSRNRGGNQPFMLCCPAVRSELPRLLRRHVGFLAALFILQTTALELRPHLPAYWVTASGRDESPFVISLGILCVCLALGQILSNRAVLERAHLEFGLPENVRATRVQDS